MTSPEITELLRDERELPSPRFAQELDEWAAAGFPRAAAPRRRRRAGLDAIRDRLASTPPRRILAPAGAALTLVVVVAVAIGEAGNFGGGDQGTATVQPVGGESVLDKGVPATSAQARGAAGGGVAATGAVREAGSSAFLKSKAAPVVRPGGDFEPFNPNRRKIARDVSLALGTSPSAFHDAADGVLDVVQAHRGYVRSSSVSGGDPGVKGAEPGAAQFDLRIPATQLDAALGELSDLGHVISRSDGTRDITQRFRQARKRITALEKTRQNLLAQLEDAFTSAEQDSLKRRIAIVESQLRSAQDQLGDAQRRVRFVPVSVSISAQEGLAGGSGDGDWSVGDALHDAGRVLEVAAGVALVSLAVLLPLGLVALAAIWGARELRRRQREAALDQR